MSNIINLLTKEQVKVLQEICDILDSALSDSRKEYPAKIIDEHGEHPYIASREEYLEDVIGHVLTSLGCSFPQLD